MKTIGLMALMALLVAGMTWGAVTCSFDLSATTAGTASSYIRGTEQNLSVTVAGTWVDENVTTGIISVAGGTITGALVYNDTDEAVTNATTVNTTIDTSALNDNQSYTFTMTLKNGSNQAELTTCTRVFRVDNTIPICSFASGLDSSSTYLATQTWTVDCTNASSATIQAGSNAIKAMTNTNGECTYSYNVQSLPEATYSTLQVVTSDTLNTTTCSLSSITVDAGASLKEVAAVVAIEGGGKQSQSGGINTTALVVIIAGAAAFWYYRKGKK